MQQSPRLKIATHPIDAVVPRSTSRYTLSSLFVEEHIELLGLTQLLAVVWSPSMQLLAAQSAFQGPWLSTALARLRDTRPPIGGSEGGGDGGGEGGGDGDVIVRTARKKRGVARRYVATKIQEHGAQRAMNQQGLLQAKLE